MDKLSEIVSSVKSDIEGFEAKLKEIILKDDNFLRNHLDEFMFSNPKRLRPIFVYLFSKILDIKNETVDNIALAVELVHSASLVHDDIIDEADLRRSKQTFYSKFGSKIAVLEGDFLLALALEVLSNCPNEIVKIFSGKIKETLLGELNQNYNLNKIQTIDEYVLKTLPKTTNLFAAGLDSLFCLKKTDDNTKDALINFMENYSIAFQIKNDINDIKLDKSSDLQCGNYTLPVIYFCLDKKIKSFEIDIFNKEKEKYVAMAVHKMNEYKKSAIEYLNKIENSIFKKELLELSEFTLRS